MLLNIPRCDYLTLTTFREHDAMLSAVADLYPKSQAKEVKKGGYQGHQWVGLFFGTGKQRQKAHFIMRASGEGAETILWRTRELNVKCTRVDLQVTIWIPNDYRTRTTYDTLASLDVEWPGRRLKPQIIQSGDGFDTLYVGSRTSDRFARIYVKPDHKGNPAYLRFEMEFKGNMAVTVRDSITQKRATAKTILASELHRLPFGASRGLRAFDKVLGAESTKIKPENVYGQNKTIDWIETQVEPAIIRLLNSHEDRDRIMSIINRWCQNFPDID